MREVHNYIIQHSMQSQRIQTLQSYFTSYFTCLINTILTSLGVYFKLKDHIWNELQNTLWAFSFQYLNRNPNPNPNPLQNHCNKSNISNYHYCTWKIVYNCILQLLPPCNALLSIKHPSFHHNPSIPSHSSMYIFLAHFLFGLHPPQTPIAPSLSHPLQDIGLEIKSVLNMFEC